ncbi:molecular chaperone [Morganella morganii]|nr:molecular chaperone [Morganella morganii]
MSTKKDMLSRLANVSKNAPLQEKNLTPPEADIPEKLAGTVSKTKVSRRPKNLQIPEDLWDAYEYLKSSNITSLLMTPYILEAFREKLAKDGAFERDK